MIPRRIRRSCQLAEMLPNRVATIEFIHLRSPNHSFCFLGPRKFPRSFSSGRLRADLLEHFFSERCSCRTLLGDCVFRWILASPTSSRGLFSAGLLRIGHFSFIWGLGIDGLTLPNQTNPFVAPSQKIRIFGGSRTGRGLRSGNDPKTSSVNDFGDAIWRTLESWAKDWADLERPRESLAEAWT